MATKIFVLALIFVAVVGVAMAAEAPATSPNSSPTPSSPKESAPVAASPTVSVPAPPTTTDSPAASPADEDEPIEFGAPAPGPGDEFAEEEPAAQEEDTEPASGASSLKVSAAVAIVAVGFFF